MRTSLLICFSCLLSFLYAQNADRVSIKLIKSEFIYQNESFPSCHASTLVDTGDGILAAWFGGTSEKNPDVCIYTSLYKDGTWIKPVVVADGVENKLIRNPTWNPVLFKRDNGDIILYYKVGPSPSTWFGEYKISTDNGHTWSKKHRIPHNLFGPIKNKPVKAPDGGILYPTSIEDGLGWRIYMEHSDQDLNNWKKIEIDNGGFNAIQPSVLFHKDGSLQLLCRSKDGKLVESWSKDGGKTWSKVEATSLPNNNSGTDAVTLKSGLHLLIYNPISGIDWTVGRNKLSIAASYDGKNWKEIIKLEDHDKGEYSYPAIIQGNDGKIYISYTYNRELIRFAVLEVTE